MVKHQKGWDIGKAAGHRVVVKAFFQAPVQATWFTTANQVFFKHLIK
jgi:hypothetical protein